MTYRPTYRLHRPTSSSKQTNIRIRPLLILSGFAIALLSSLSIGIARAAETVPTVVRPSLMITGVQVNGTCTNTSGTSCVAEYVEIYNPSATKLQITNWKLRYISASGSTITPLTDITGSIAAHGYALVSHVGYLEGKADLTLGTTTDTGKLNNTDGHVDIIDSSSNVIDKVGWGAATKALGSPAAAPASNKALQRKADAAGQLVHTANNANDFAVIDRLDPQYGGFTVPEPAAPTPPPTPATTTETTTAATAPKITCEGIIISELMPNPAGTDTGREFVEFHNPTNEVVALDSCSLQSTASASKTYTFSGISLQPGEYRSFTDTATGITLPNSAGGTVWLLSPTEEIQSITYPGNMEDDTVWALVDGVWAKSFTPTPGAANVATPLKPCDDPTQVRSADTGRCATPAIEAASSTSTTATAVSTQTPCKVGQERNPVTNRCRNIVSATSTTTACKAGQERNPETNRCRNIAASGSTAKACPAGQERNPDTNRCRKVNGAASMASVKDIAADPTTAKAKPYWLIAAVIAVCAIAYAIYEWHQEIGQLCKKHFGKQLNKLPLVKLAPNS